MTGNQEKAFRRDSRLRLSFLNRCITMSLNDLLLVAAAAPSSFCTCSPKSLSLPCYGTPDQILPVRLRGRSLFIAYFKVTECQAPPAQLFSLRARHLCRGGRLVFKHMIKIQCVSLMMR